MSRNQKTLMQISSTIITLIMKLTQARYRLFPVTLDILTGQTGKGAKRDKKGQKDE